MLSVAKPAAAVRRPSPRGMAGRRMGRSPRRMGGAISPRRVAVPEPDPVPINMNEYNTKFIE